MRIKRLYLKGFGKFVDTRITLEDGLNIIYGPNEAGKSTLHRFIEAMCFGFVKPGVKRRVMLEEYDRYRPWIGDVYEGSLVYETGGKIYRVERDLYKGREGVRVFDDTTGEEITRSFKYDKGSREFLFCEQHTGLNLMLFRNTISIGQLGSKSDRQLAAEIGARLSNLGTSGDAEVSVSRAERHIREYLDSIGTERALTREYGRLFRRRDELEAHVQVSRKRMEDIRKRQQRLMELENRAAALEYSRGELEGRILYARYCDLKGREENLSREVESLTKQLEELKRDNRLPDQGDINRAEQLKDRIDRLERRREDPAGYRLRIERERLARRLGGTAFRLALSVAGILASAALGRLVHPIIYGLAVASLAWLVYTVKALASDRGRMGRLNATLQQMEKEHRSEEEELKRLGKEMEGILSRWGVDTVYHMNIKAKEYELVLERACRLQDRIEEREEETGRVSGELARVREELVRLMGEVQVYVRGDVNAEHMEEFCSRFDDGRRLKGQMADMKGPREGPEGMIADIRYGMPDQGGCAGELASCRSRLEEVKRAQNETAAAMENVRGGIEILQRDTVSAAELEEQLETVEGRLKILEQERRAAGIALDLIMEASAEVHREFAPMLNEKIRDIVHIITGGRYGDLRITKDLEILTVVPETGRWAEVDLLSGGTADQFYFAGRMAIADLLTCSQNLPMILDDSFVQYDAGRLENIMSYLLEVSQGRQIILFTCHNREKGIADRLGGSYNYLEL